MGTLNLNQDHGSLTIRTTVEGRASRMGHRLTISVDEWSATVELDGERPMSLTLTALLPSIQVISGDGGVTPISPVDKAAIKHNALKSVKADTHPEVRYDADEFVQTDDGYDVHGVLTINGSSAPHPAHVVVSEATEGWKVRALTAVVQSEFGIKPYSLMVGALRVGDEVTIEFNADVARSALAD